MQNDWPPEQLTDGGPPVDQGSSQQNGHTHQTLPQPATFYIAPMAILKPPPPAPLNTAPAAMTVAVTTTKTPQVFFKSPPQSLAVFPNKLPHSDAEDSSSNITPLNPAPMLKPNPFINHQGQQIQFATKAGTGNGNSFKGPPHRREEGAFCRRSFDGRSGYCILAYQCLHVIREYRVHGTKIDICTYRRNIPVICCPLADKHIDDQRISAQSK